MQPGAKRAQHNVRMPCPVHQAGQREGDSLSVAQGLKGPVWHCFAGCDATEVRDALLRLGILEYNTTTEDNDMNKINHDYSSIITRKPPIEFGPSNRWIFNVWRQSTTIREPVLNYLKSRAIPPAVAFTAARGGRTLRQRITRDGVELLANISDNTGHMVGLHRTVISKSGQVLKRRSHGTIKGAAIRLFTDNPRVLEQPEDHCFYNDIAIAEGIETAMSFRIFEPTQPVWSVISANGIQTFEPPPKLHRITVAADFDGAGLVAYERLERRLRSQIRVMLRLPHTHGQDWNDALKETPFIASK